MWSRQNCRRSTTHARKMVASNLGKIRAKFASMQKTKTRAPARTSRTKVVVVGPHSEVRHAAVCAFMSVEDARLPTAIMRNFTVDPPNDLARRKIYRDHAYDVRILSSVVHENIDMWDVVGPVEHGLRDGYFSGASLILIVVPESDETEKVVEDYAREIRREFLPNNVQIKTIVVSRDATVSDVVEDLRATTRDVSSL